MVVRITYLSFLPEKIDEAKKIYNNELAPVVKRQPGNFDCRLLEPVDKSDEYISMTAWDSIEDADDYQTSSTYKELIERVKSLYSKNPVLKVYTTEDAMESV